MIAPAPEKGHGSRCFCVIQNDPNGQFVAIWLNFAEKAVIICTKLPKKNMQTHETQKQSAILNMLEWIRFACAGGIAGVSICCVAFRAAGLEATALAQNIGMVAGMVTAAVLVKALRVV
jgi:hypothetical protein